MTVCACVPQDAVDLCRRNSSFTEEQSERLWFAVLDCLVQHQRDAKAHADRVHAATTPGGAVHIAEEGAAVAKPRPPSSASHPAPLPSPRY